MDKFLQATGYYAVEAAKTFALVQCIWNGSPIGQSVNPYFAKAPQAVEQVAKSVKSVPKCITVDGRKICEK